MSGWSRDDQRAYLAALSAPIEADIRSTIDRSFAVEWVFDEADDYWSFRCFASEAGYGYGEDVVPPESELDRQEQMQRIVFDIANNLWPDEWTEPWPICPDHHDHPLNPELRSDRLCWVCDRNRRIAVPVGELVPPGGTAPQWRR